MMDLQEIFVECDTNETNSLELGIVVVAPLEPPGGLKITKIQPGSAVDRNGLFKEGDVILKVNGISLQNISFKDAQGLLKRELQPTITLTVRRTTTTTTTPTTTTTTTTNATTNTTKQQKDNSNKHFVEALNTRMVGVEHHIRLKKGPEGLGFKIAARDNRSRARCPIKITSINQQGAAIMDGNLKPGDMLLKVNGIDLADKSQDEVANILRKIQTNEYADIVISRLHATPPSDDSGSFSYEKGELASQNNSVATSTTPSEQIESLVLDIPLNDTGSAGLGIQIKTPILDDKVDLGIWVDKIMQGGAAWKDGRLQPDDQLTAINGISLVGLTIAAAKETIAKAAVQASGPDATPNVIRLSILRRKKQISPERSFSSPITQASTSIEQNSSSKTNATKSPDTELTNVTHSQGTLSAFTAPHAFDSSSLNESYRNLNISASLQSLEGELTEGEVAESFRRDGFGRQSMSEKRHAQLNAKNTDTYRRSRKAKEDREQEEQIRLETERQKMAELANNRRSLNLSQIQHNSNRLPSSNCAMNSIALTLPKHYRQYHTPQTTNHSYSNELPVDVQISREPCMTLELQTNEDSSMGLSHSINNFQSPKIHAPVEINSTPRTNHHRTLEPEVDSINNRGSRHIFSSTSCFKCRSPGSCPYHHKSDDMSAQLFEERAPTKKEPDMSSNSSGSKKGSSLFRFFKLGSRKEKKKKDDTVASTNNSYESSTSQSEAQSEQKNIARQDAKREQEKIDQHYRKFVQQRQQSPNGFATQPRLQNQVPAPARFALQRSPESHKYSNGNSIDPIRPQIISHSHHHQQAPDVYMEKQQNVNQPIAKFALQRPSEDPYRIDINSIQAQQYNQYIGQNQLHQKTINNHLDQNRLSMTTRVHPQRPPVCPQFLNNVNNGNINIAQPRQYYQYMNQQPYHHQYINQQQNHHQYINQPPLHRQYINQQPHLHQYNNQQLHPHQYNNQPSHHHQAMSIYLDQAHQHPSQIPTNTYLQYSQIL